MRERLSFISLSSSSVDRSFFLSLSLSPRSKGKEIRKEKKQNTMEPCSAPQPLQQEPPRMASRALELLPPVNG